MTFKLGFKSEVISKLFGFKTSSQTDLPFLLFVNVSGGLGMGWKDCVARQKSLHIMRPVKRFGFCSMCMV